MGQLYSVTPKDTDPKVLDNHDDVELIKRISAKDPRAFELLYSRYYSRLLRFIHRITHRLELIEEIHNDTMFVVWQNASQFDMRSRVSTWIHGIAYHKSLKTLKQLGPQHRDALANIPLPPDPKQPDELLADTQDRHSINEALHTLSPEHRTVMELTYFQGYSYHEIAEVMACPVNTVKTRMFYAREKLRKLLPNLHEE